LAGNLLNQNIETEIECMMMKKKQKEQESIENNQNNTTEYLETTHTPEDFNSSESYLQPSDDSAKPSAEGSNEADISVDKVNPEVRAIEEKLAEMQNKYLRLSAEFDNYRKRTLREKMELSKYAAENLLLKIIPLMDDFERALKHMDTATDCAAMKEGIDLIYVKFSEFLKQNGVKEIESLNIDFNVDLHEAVAKVSVQDEKNKGKIMDVLEKGYFLQEKVLRFSKVVVGE
jgi:molecular chaperone GrpE